MRLGHIAISVSSLTRSIAFYSKYFGVKVIARYKFKDKGMQIVIVKNNDLTLELFKISNSKPLPQYRRKLDTDLKTLGVKHFSLETNNIAVLYNKFRKARVEIAVDLRAFADGRKYFFIKDPDGILIEIMELKVF